MFISHTVKMANFEVITQSTVNVAITSSISSFAVDKRYPKNLTIGELKVYSAFIILELGNGLIFI